MKIKKAFTLVELLVVISIIALLLSVLIPSLSKARRQAKMVDCANRQKSIVNAVNLWMADNPGDGLPPTTQGSRRSSNSIHWTIPNRLKYRYGNNPGLNGGSVIDVLGRYMKNPDYFNCPLSRNDVGWQEEYLKRANDEEFKILSCSYFLLWNWKALKDRGFNPTRGGDSLIVNDFFLGAGPSSLHSQTYGGPQWISSHPFEGASNKPFKDLSGLSNEINLWMKLDPALSTPDGYSEMPSMRLNSGFLDGHVEGINTGTDYEAMNPSPLYTFLLPERRR